MPVERDREELMQEAQRAQRIVLSAIMQKVSLPTFLDLDISMAQLKGMFILATSLTSTVSQLAEVLRIGRSAASLLVDRMVADGLVERTEDPEDRRRTMLRLSQRGEELISRLRQGREERNPLPAWLARLSDQDLRALVQGLQALAAEAQAGASESLLLHSWPDQHR